MFCSYTCSRVHIGNLIQLRGQAIHNKHQEKYNNNHKHCLNCDTPISYDNRYNKFCCRSCSASYTNKHRDPECYQKSKLTLSLNRIPQSTRITKINWCKVTGKPISKLRPHDCDPWYKSIKVKTISRLAEAYNITLRTKNTSIQLSAALDNIKLLYEEHLMCPSEIAKILNISKELVYYILKLAHVQLRDNVTATLLSKLTQESKPVKNQYKTGYHKDWQGISHFYRSSYELKTYKQLDNIKLSYQTESIRIVYEDSQKSCLRVAIPDIVIDNNIIIEVKSTYTYDRSNMSDKWGAYHSAGYQCILVLDHVWYDHLV